MSRRHRKPNGLGCFFFRRLDGGHFGASEFIPWRFPPTDSEFDFFSRRVLYFGLRMPWWWNGRHSGLKILRGQPRAGSNPAQGIIVLGCDPAFKGRAKSACSPAGARGIAMRKLVSLAILWTVLAVGNLFYLLKGVDDKWFSIVLVVCCSCQAILNWLKFISLRRRNSQQSENAL